MFRFPYSQTRLLSPDKAAVGLYPCAYVQHDNFTWTAPDAVNPPYGTYGIGVGCPSTDTGRKGYSGERYLSGITPENYSFWSDTFYSDWQVLHDGDKLTTMGIFVQLGMYPDTNFWYRGENGQSRILMRKVSDDFTEIGAGVDVAADMGAGWNYTAGGTRWESIGLSIDPFRRDHALLIASKVGISPWSSVSTTSTGCDLSGESSYWQLNNTLSVHVWEALDWQNWTYENDPLVYHEWDKFDYIGEVFSVDNAAVCPLAHWVMTEYPVLVEFLPSGEVMAAVSYPTAWGDKCKSEWPLPKLDGDAYHTGFEASDHKHFFGIIDNYKSTPWDLTEYTWPHKTTYILS